MARIVDPTIVACPISRGASTIAGGIRKECDGWTGMRWGLHGLICFRTSRRHSTPVLVRGTLFYTTHSGTYHP
eukprot:scaffold2868_cov348-Pavlova_lutheri.AAC.26